MEDGKIKPLKPKTKDINKDLNSAYNKDLGGREIPITTPNEKEEILEEEKVESNVDEELIDDSEGQPFEDFVSEYTEQIEKLTKENEQLKDQMIRKTAEMDNILKRSIKEKNELIEYGNMMLLNKFLPLMDDFTKAIEVGSKNQDYEALFTGIQMIFKKAEKTFEEAGVKKMEIEPGTKFDVHLHEALLQMPSEEIEEGCIVQIAQDGFMLRDRVLRHAKVVTSAGKAE